MKIYAPFVLLYALGLTIWFWTVQMNIDYMFAEIWPEGFSQASMYSRHAAFWGGNPAEVYSHWLNVIAFSGVLPFFFLGSALESSINQHRTVWTFWRTPLFGTVIAAIAWSTCVYYDLGGGEGVVPGCVIILFLPFLLLLLPPAAIIIRHIRNGPARLLLAVGLSGLMFGSQLLFEPSGTGAPNNLILPIGFAFAATFWTAAAVIMFRTLAIIRAKGYDLRGRDILLLLLFLPHPAGIPPREEMQLIPGFDGTDFEGLLKIIP